MPRGVADSEEVRNAKRIQRYIKYKEWQAAKQRHDEWLKCEAAKQQARNKEREAREEAEREKNGPYKEREFEMTAEEREASDYLLNRGFSKYGSDDRY